VTRLHWIILGTVITGIALGAAWPPPPLPRQTGDDDEWTPPAASLERVPQEAASQLAAVRWSGDQHTEPGAEGQQSWRLVGIVHAPQPVALVMTEGKNKQNLRLEAGGTLPDGTRLAAIEHDLISVEGSSCQRTFQVHRRNPIRTSGECGTDNRDTEQRKSP